MSLLRLTPYTLKDLTVTSSKKDNTPNEEQKSNLLFFRNKILLPIFLKFGLFKINSAFRSKAVNEEKGGVSNSQHCANNGEAAGDLTFGSSSKNIEIWNELKKTQLPIDQCILETWSDGRNIIHISTKKDKTKNRRSFFELEK